MIFDIINEINVKSLIMLLNHIQIDYLYDILHD